MARFLCSDRVKNIPGTTGGKVRVQAKRADKQSKLGGTDESPNHVSNPNRVRLGEENQRRWLHMV